MFTVISSGSIKKKRLIILFFILQKKVLGVLVVKYMGILYNFSCYEHNHFF